MISFWSGLANYLSRRFLKKSAEQINSSLFDRFSHELRTSLTGVVGYAEFLENRSDDSMVNFTAKIIRESGLELGCIVNSFITLQSLQKNKIRLSCQYFSFVDLIRDVVDSRNKSIMEKGCYLDLVIPDEFSDVNIGSDFIRLREILDGLFLGTLICFQKNSVIRIELSNGISTGFCVLSLFFNQNQSGPLILELYKNFWNQQNYVFRLQQGPGVILAATKAMLKFMDVTVSFLDEDKYLSPRLDIAFPFKIIR